MLSKIQTLLIAFSIVWSIKLTELLKAWNLKVVSFDIDRLWYPAQVLQIYNRHNYHISVEHLRRVKYKKNFVIF